MRSPTATGVPFPRSLEDITPDWITRALAVNYPGTRINGMRFGTVIRGMATKAQLHLDYNEAGRTYALPGAMWVKAGLETHSATLAATYRAEVNFFRELAPRLAVNCPNSYFQLLDEASGNGLVLLEDLTARNVSFGRQTEPLKPAAAARVLELQASYHARLWSAPELDQLRWLTPGGAIREANVVDTFLGFWGVAEKQPRFEHVPSGLRDPARIRRALLRLQEIDDREGQCVVHGDAHPGNLYFERDGRPGYLDWQTVMRGHWAFDVTYFLISALTVADRRAHERDLLKHYLGCLSRHGAAAPPFDLAWSSHRQHAIWTFLTTLCPVEMHPEEICVLNAERSCAALADLQTLESLEV
jgi:hypothetical protein